MGSWSGGAKVESFLHNLGGQLLSTASNGYFQMLVIMIVIMYSRERERLKATSRIINDMKELNDHWEAVVSELKKSHAAEKQQMIQDFHEQVRAVRDAEDIVWVKMDAESLESSFAVSRRKPRH
jgi:galactokinase/mevalonate kinase-like predicted kinase